MKRFRSSRIKAGSIRAAMVGMCLMGVGDEEVQEQPYKSW
jgi:hypothetical protein